MPPKLSQTSWETRKKGSEESAFRHKKNFSMYELRVSVLRTCQTTMEDQKKPASWSMAPRCENGRSALCVIASKLGWEMPSYSFVGDNCQLEIRRFRKDSLRFSGRTAGSQKKHAQEAAALKAMSALSVCNSVTFELGLKPFSCETFFDRHFAGEVNDASVLWPKFWRYVKNGGTMVGIDTEGNGGDGWPRLIQVATPNLVLLEVVPLKSKNVSSEMQKLLKDTTITKLFCDSSANKDAKSLGLTYGRKDVVNIEDEIEKNATKNILREDTEKKKKQPTRKGLVRICNLLGVPEKGCRLTKDEDGWRFFESARGQNIQFLTDVPEKHRKYAAIDAWMTLIAGQRLLTPPSVTSATSVVTTTVEIKGGKRPREEEEANEKNKKKKKKRPRDEAEARLRRVALPTVETKRRKKNPQTDHPARFQAAKNNKKNKPKKRNNTDQRRPKTSSLTSLFS